MRLAHATRACFLAALACVTATGCRLDPGVTVPPVSSPQGTWRDGVGDVATLANVPWFDIYQDEVLRELITEALVANPDLGIALARVDEARALAQAAGADLYPRVDLSAAAGGVTSSRLEVPFGDRTSGLASVSFDLLWELDVFGRVQSQSNAARARYFASVEAHRDVGIRLIAEVARAYFELRETDELLLITGSTLQANREYVVLAKDRFEGGKTSEIDFRQSESEEYRTEGVYVDVQRRITSKENELSILLGRPPTTLPRGRRAHEQTFPGPVPAGLPSELLKRRPDIAAAEMVLIAETSLVGAARANLYPRIALTGSAGWESDALSDLFSGGSNTASLIAGLLQPIFDAGRNRALVTAQCARMRAAMETYRKVVLAAFAEVENALVDYRRFTEQRAVGERRLTALRKVLELADIRYVGGKAAYLEVLDAQRALFDAELEQADTIQAQLVSLTALYKALGGGWEGSATGTACRAPPARATSCAPPRATCCPPPPPPPAPPAPPPPPPSAPAASAAPVGVPPSGALPAEPAPAGAPPAGVAPSEPAVPLPGAPTRKP